ncbi:hypothetical protein R8Z50_19465 [Longispora sp. K20-0274]|uniref:hypothetical protein n=1 Tax=Longispora sp. K20-0274 TaxID=3088255 RepID=UPI003999F119
MAMTLTAPARRSTALTGLLALAALAALGLAVRAPLATTVLGLLAFGIAHNVLELRYVVGRFGDVLTGRTLWLSLALVTGIVGCRLAGLAAPTPARYAEIALGYGVLAVGVAAGARGGWRLGGWAVLAVGLASSTAWPAYHFVILTHLHNLVPLAFLWDWSRRLPGRGMFRAAQLGWVLVIPGLILAGAADGWLDGAASTVAAFAGDPARVLAVSAPPGQAATTVGLRFLAVFAFLQTMHYVVWVGFLPRFAPDVTAAFQRRVPGLSGWRPWALGVGAGALLAVLLVTSYADGRAAYSALASYHAYLEFPVLLAMLRRSPSEKIEHS